MSRCFQNEGFPSQIVLPSTIIMLLARLCHVSAWTNMQPILECSGVAILRFSSAARFNVAHRCPLLPCFSAESTPSGRGDPRGPRDSNSSGLPACDVHTCAQTKPAAAGPTYVAPLHVLSLVCSGYSSYVTRSHCIVLCIGSHCNPCCGLCLVLSGQQ